MASATRFPGLRHFVLTGVVFAIVLGWVSTFVINNAIGIGTEKVLGVVLTDYYLGALLLTAISIGLIALCIYAGNRSFVRRVPVGLTRKNLINSTALFSLFVMGVVLPQFGELVDRIAYNLSWAYRNPEEVMLMASLPLLRLIVLPAIYYAASTKQVLNVDA